MACGESQSSAFLHGAEVIYLGHIRWESCTWQAVRGHSTEVQLVVARKAILVLFLLLALLFSFVGLSMAWSSSEPQALHCMKCQAASSPYPEERRATLALPLNHKLQTGGKAVSGSLGRQKLQEEDLLNLPIPLQP